MSRPIKLDTPLDDGALLFRSMTVTEELGRPFEYQLEVLAPDERDIAFGDVVGKPMTVHLEQGGGGERLFNGIVARFGFAGHIGRNRAYRATLRPTLWLLTRRSNCRIFQTKSTPDILAAIFKEYGLTFNASLSATYPAHDYKVQYRETDFDFVSRLMEEAGIYYYFTHEVGQHTLVLADSYGAHATVEGYETVPFKSIHERAGVAEEHVASWVIEQEIEPSSYLINDFDFTRPAASLLVKRISRASGSNDRLEMYDYPGAYTQNSDGDALVRVRLEELEAQQIVAQAEGNVRGLAAGALFSLSESTRDADNTEYLVTSLRAELRAVEYESGQRAGDAAETYQASFTAIASQRPFRSPRRTPRPVVRGPQTAIVVGQSGEEIWTDQYGRVKLQFHWDREGKSDDNSSCWVRVAQLWAGGAWGAIFTPRIGQEVVVDFLEGDPDRPLVTGRLYNGANAPPYALPDNQTQSGIKSRSSKGGGADNFNELRFEDKKGSELVYMQAEKDHSVLVKHDEAIEVDHDRTKTVKNDETTQVDGNRTETVGKDEKITVKGNRTEEVDGNEKITIKGNRTEEVDGSETITIKVDRTEEVDGNEKITVKGNRTEEVDGNEQITIKGNRTETVDGDESVTVKGKRALSVTGDDATTVDGKQSFAVTKDVTWTVQGKRSATVTQDDAVSATGKITFSSDQQIVLTAGAASITLKVDGTIEIKGVKVTVQGDAQTQVKAGGQLTLSAPMISAG